MSDVKLHIQDDQVVVVDNGILQLTFTVPEGALIGIQYNGIDNLLELHNPELNGGFWDLNWAEPGNQGTRGQFDKLNGTSFEVVTENEEQVELSFKRTWDTSLQGEHAPLYIDKRFIMLRGSSGFYSYAIYEHSEDMPSFVLYETRIAFMLKIDKFRYMAIADNRQRHMPLPDDRLPGRGEELAYPEAVRLVDPIEPEFRGEVDDKYQYSCENKDNRVHGWICFDPPVGFWQISPTNEFRTGGPVKQDLTSHVNPTTLAMFVSAHYGGVELSLQFKSGEPWKKVFGPVFIYLNSVSDGGKALSLWDDAKEQMKVETQGWPYSFPNSEDFPNSDQRGTVTGRLLVQDRYTNKQPLPASGAYVGLALPGETGSWQTESKGYQFWTTVDEKGKFCIKNVRAGDYNLYAWVPGFIGDYLSDVSITITSGCEIDTGDLVYEPPRHGPTLWEIGIPDRSAAEFYIPDPNPKYQNKLFLNHPDRFRQYGLWERYADLYPDGDLVYTVSVSDYQRDWFFAHVSRKTGDDTYEATTWQIKFHLKNVYESGAYKLRLALASATHSVLEVRINDPQANRPQFSSGLIGTDNAIARHGIHGLYYLFNVDIPYDQLVEGDNTIFLTQTSSTSPFHGIMYDYIRLEGPPSPNS
ncbi:Rhamnogalacturonate lyase [Actinidia chinensis var. chinensis]|uniref:rhamnogalacturonan endolyase n=1 Tax=Actinidia chinensis var. chinensis TaxID=1590841 RepID=A0A2R6QY59_ACTCC|nr:Rhamnogalacturonate lyase [Actinidia chinensis var. chinensis]